MFNLYLAAFILLFLAWLASQLKKWLPMFEKWWDCLFVLLATIGIILLGVAVLLSVAQSESG